MSRHANPTLIGAFVLGALVLTAASVIVLGGSRWFQERRQHVMYFEGAAQGLQVGAPVMFLGVRIGTVKRIQLGLDQESHRFLVPVTIEVEPQVVQSNTGEQIDLQDRAVIRQLIDRGLRARLRTQSLLTGQLYVDLDFYPDKPARFFAADPSISEIPAIPTTTEEFATKFEGFPMDKFLKEVASISSSIHTLLADPAVKSIPVRLDATLSRLQSLAVRLDEGSGPLIADLRENVAGLAETLEAVQAAMIRTGAAADRVGTASDRIGEASVRVGAAADQLGRTAAPDSPLMRNMAEAGGTVAEAARAIRDLAAEDSPTVARLNEAIREIDRAARALKLLADTLERQPEAVVRGKY
ncbi:MAG: MlaD family protein [Thermodesulfobacteriota bacterium]